MPVKKVICSICGQEVNHRQTLALGDNKRACRSHSETQLAAEDMRAGEKFAKEKEQEKWGKKHHRREEEYIPSTKARCWICHREGLRQQEFVAKWFVEQKKFEIIHGHHHNPFDPAEVKAASGKLANETCLWYAKWSGENTKIKVSKSVYDMIMTSQSFFGEAVFLVCEHCRAEKGFKTMTDEKMEADVADNKFWEQAVKYTAIYDVLVDPLVTKQAQQELAAAN